MVSIIGIICYLLLFLFQQRNSVWEQFHVFFCPLPSNFGCNELAMKCFIIIIVVNVQVHLLKLLLWILLRAHCTVFPIMGLFERALIAIECLVGVDSTSTIFANRTLLLKVLLKGMLPFYLLRYKLLITFINIR